MSFRDPDGVIKLLRSVFIILLTAFIVNENRTLKSLVEAELVGNAVDCC